MGRTVQPSYWVSLTPAVKRRACVAGVYVNLNRVLRVAFKLLCLRRARNECRHAFLMGLRPPRTATDAVTASAAASASADAAASAPVPSDSKLAAAPRSGAKRKPAAQSAAATATAASAPKRPRTASADSASGGALPSSSSSSSLLALASNPLFDRNALLHVFEFCGTFAADNADAPGGAECHAAVKWAPRELYREHATTTTTGTATTTPTAATATATATTTTVPAAAEAKATANGSRSRPSHAINASGAVTASAGSVRVPSGLVRLLECSPSAMLYELLRPVVKPTGAAAASGVAPDLLSSEEHQMLREARYRMAFYGRFQSNAQADALSHAHSALVAAHFAAAPHSAALPPVRYEVRFGRAEAAGAAKETPPSAAASDSAVPQPPTEKDNAAASATAAAGDAASSPSARVAWLDFDAVAEDNWLVPLSADDPQRAVILKREVAIRRRAVRIEFFEKYLRRAFPALTAAHCHWLLPVARVPDSSDSDTLHATTLLGFVLPDGGGGDDATDDADSDADADGAAAAPASSSSSSSKAGGSAAQRRAALEQRLTRPGVAREWAALCQVLRDSEASDALFSYTALTGQPLLCVPRKGKSYTPLTHADPLPALPIVLPAVKDLYRVGTLPLAMPSAQASMASALAKELAAAKPKV